MTTPYNDDTTPAYDDTRDYLYACALRDLLMLFDTKDPRDRKASIAANLAWLHQGGFSQLVLDTYSALGDCINETLNCEEGMEWSRDFKKRLDALSQKHEQSRARLIPPVQDGPGRKRHWAMSIEEFRQMFRKAKQDAGPNASLVEIAKHMGMHVTTLRIWRRREDADRQLKQELGRTPTEAEIEERVTTPTG